MWSILLQSEINKFIEFRNSVPTRYDAKKPAGLSGKSRNELYAQPEDWDGKDYLVPVDLKVVRAMKEHLGGDDLIAFVPREFAERAEAAFLDLHILAITLDNVWRVFTILHEKLFAA